MNKIDVSANRDAGKWGRREQVGRVMWGVCKPFFMLSPRPLWGWRRLILRAFGARIGKGVHVYPSVRIAIPWHLKLEDKSAIGDRANLYALGLIKVGKRATVSQNAHLCAGTHDITRPDRPLVKLPISVEADAWVAADAFIGPGVTVREGAIVGARAVTMKDVPRDSIVVGNPARPTGVNRA